MDGMGQSGFPQISGGQGVNGTGGSGADGTNVDIAMSDSGDETGLTQATAQIGLSGSKWDRLFSDILENHALQHLDILQAGHAVGGPRSGIKLRSQLIGWEPLNKTMQTLGFRLESADHWGCFLEFVYL